MKLALIFLILIFSQNLWAACRLEGPALLKIAASTEDQVAYPYQSSGALKFETAPSVTIHSCKEEAQKRKYLLIALGASFYDLNAATIDVAYSGDTGEQLCKIDNSPFEYTQNYSTRKNNYKLKTKFITKCVETYIRTTNRAPLKFSKNNPLCQVTMLNKQLAKITGPKCYVKAFQDAEYKIHYRIKQECSKISTLDKLGLRPMEINALSSFASVKSADGNDNDIEIISSRVVNFHVEPLSTQMNLSEDWSIGIPKFPNKYIVPEVHFATPTFSSEGPSTTISIPLLVDHSCNKTCNSSRCTKQCDYSVPIAAEYTLYELKKNKKIYIKSWYDGAIIPPRYQGISGTTLQYFSSRLMEAGKRYSVEVEFRDPKLDYSMFTNGLNPLFIPLPGIPSSDFARNISQGILDIEGPRPLNGVESIRIINEYDPSRPIGNISPNGIPGISPFQYWPPYYEKVCDKKTKNCQAPGNNAFLKMTLSFDVIGLDEDEEKFTLGNIVTSKNNFLNKQNTSTNVSKFPSINCNL